MKFRAIGTILLSLAFVVPMELIQASDTDRLFSLCSKFPHNSKCKNYQAPIPLKSRSGEEALCLFPNQEEAEKCKVLLTEELLTFYMETGKALTVLEGAKNTQESSFAVSAIESFSYSEKKKTDIGAVLAFGLWGLLAKKKTSTFNIYFEPTETTEEVNTTENSPKKALFVIKRKIGREMRQDIEQKTNLVAEILDIE